jgi:hypothetical protein
MGQSEPSGQTPRSDEARTITRLWSELLGGPEPPIDANFFAIGGHSLAVLQLAARMQQAFGLMVPIADLFENLTIESQVRLVERLYQEQLADVLDVGGTGEGLA